MKSLSPVRLFATPWTVANQAPPSMEFSMQAYWSGLPFPSPGDLPTQGSNLGLPHCRQALYHLTHQESPSLLKSLLCFPISLKILSPHACQQDCMLWPPCLLSPHLFPLSASSTYLSRPGAPRVLSHAKHSPGSGLNSCHPPSPCAPPSLLSSRTKLICKLLVFSGGFL